MLCFNTSLHTVVQAFGDLGAAVGVTSACWQDVHVQHRLSEQLGIAGAPYG